TSSLIEYLLAKLLSFQGFIVLFGVGSLSYKVKNKVFGSV
ncbi:M13 family peptidase, partial [Lactobacillus delbrueckii subsp. lactis]|nr:M13 family peptidase [Lactobacillus delbrueckii subsp. lactis]